VNEIAPAFRAHIDREIARRKATPDDIDDVLDLDAYNAEVEQEDIDAVAIQSRKGLVAEFLRSIPDAE